MKTTDFRFCGDSFPLTLDPRFFYPSQAYQTAYTGLLAGIRERKGFILLTGPDGAGKTTLLGQLVNHADPLVRYIFFDGATLTNVTFEDVLRLICTELGLPHDQNGQPKKLQALGADLIARSKEGKTVALLIDEAQGLTDEALGPLRSLSPIDMNSEKPLLQVVLIGPPQLEAKLDRPKLRPLKNRIALRCRLQGLEEREVVPFIYRRCTANSERQELFTPEALRRIAVYSKGTPGSIINIWNKALQLASEASLGSVSDAIVEDVARVLRLLPEPVDLSDDLRKEVMDTELDAGEGNTADKAFVTTADPRPFDQPQPQRSVDTIGVPTITSRRLPWGPSLSGVALLVFLATGLLYYYRWPASVFTPAPPRLPEITRATPPVHSGQELVVAEGQRLAFAIEVKNPGPESVQYVWFLNGREKARGTHWVYEPRFDEGGFEPKTVTARVIDRGNRVVERNWQVRVQDVNRSPTITAIFPSIPKVEVTIGQEQRFALSAVDPDTDDQLTYAWAIDGAEVAHGPSWTFTPADPVGESERTVTVRVSDKAGDTLERRWAVTVMPAPLQPPLITRATPVGEELTVAEGQMVMFDVEATSAQPEPLQYVWLLDGQEHAQGSRWRYRPEVDEGRVKPKTVTVRVTDRERHTVERTWRLSIQRVNRPPVFTTASPSVRRLTLSPEAEQNFSVQATDPDKDSALLYVWSLDGREVARGQEWRFRPPLPANRRHEVRVEVADSDGLRNHLTWSIVVKQPPLPPKILDARPADEQVVLQVGNSSVFTVRAEQPDAEGATLHYEWKINDGPPQILPTGRFHLAGTLPGRYQLTAVAISPEGVRSAPRRWTVEVRPPTPVPPSEMAAVPPPVVASPPQLPVSREEVQTWLEAQRQALEERDVNRLVELGAIPSSQAERARKILSRYESFHVTLRDVEIQVSANQATVEFSRIDTIDGHTVPHPDRIVFTLGRGRNGGLTARLQ